MNRISSKKKAIIVLMMVLMVSVMPVITLFFNNSAVKAEIIVLYDENNDTAIKSSDLLFSLITDSEVGLKKIPISNNEDLIHQIQGLSKTIVSLILIGHGSQNGFHIGEEISRWSDLRELVLNNSVDNALFLSCYSSLLCLNQTEEMVNQYITFDCKIDYVVASYAGAILLSHKLDLEDLQDKIYDEAIDNLEFIVDHTLYDYEPLWWGTTHKNLASNAISQEIPQELLDILSYQTQTYMKKANEADVVDQVTSATIEIILDDPVRRDLWLKHNYGTRGGITIAVFWVPVYTVPVYHGTAPDATQTAYNAAVEAYKRKDYVEAGKQLSYAVHYGQDMTMPYHVYDYLTLYLNIFNPINLVTILINLAKFLDDYGDLEVHDIIEEWAHDEWNSNTTFVSEILAKVTEMEVAISDGSESIYECVEEIAKWTRGQKRENQMERLFKKDDEEAKREVILPLLAKGIAFTAALYKKFIDDVSDAPERPSRPTGPYLSYVNNSNTFKFETIDPNGDPVKFEIEWGDGIIEDSNFVESGSICEVEHTYSMTGVYNVSARAIDHHDNQKKLLWSEWSEIKEILIELEPIPPPEPSKPSIGGPTSIFVNNIATYTARSYDPEGHFLIYKFDFGDGYIWYSDPAQSGVSVDHSHIYTNAGTRTLTVTVENTKGGTNQNSLEIEIIENPVDPVNEAPIIDSILGPTDGEINSLHQFQFEAIDPNGDDVKYEIDWGDGEIYETQFVTSGVIISESHRWTSEGFYWIRYRAQDENGLWSSWSSLHVIQISDGGPILDP